MKVCVMGLWHLGSVTAACAASLGHHVIAYDPDPVTIAALNRGEPPVGEPGLLELIAEQRSAGRLEFSHNLQLAVGNADVVWITFDTPVDEHDHADTAFVVEQIRSTFPYIKHDSLVLVSSQLPVGSMKALEKDWARVAGDRAVCFAYSPENLRLGKALDVFLAPDRIVVGIRNPADTTDAAAKVQRVFGSLSDRIVWMGTESAEMTKHAVNAFLATSVTFINELARLCELVGADAADVERGLKTESRIGPRAYLGPGSAFAGGTLARDVQFLRGIGRNVDRATPLLDGIWDSNTAHRSWIADRLQHVLGPLANRRIGVWGLTYKPGTTALRRSDAVTLCCELANRGAIVVAHDPTVDDRPSELDHRVFIGQNALQAATDADAVVVATTWPTYRDVTGEALFSAMRRPLVLDPNRFLDGTIGRDDRFEYLSVGKSAREQ